MVSRLLSDPFYYIEGRHIKPKKGGGGSIDTSGLEQATNRAINLQKEIYDLTREDVQPWYQVGVGGVNKLADLLGLSGGSVKSREQLYNSLLPQYTTQQNTGGAVGAGDIWQGTDGRLYSSQDDAALGSFSSGGRNMEDYGEQQDRWMNNVSLFQPAAQTQDYVDYQGLNAAVDAALANQGTPEGYGSLLENFDMSKFEQDPSYQFRQDEANKALQRQMAAQGVTLGGGGYGEINPQAMRAMNELTQNLASQEYASAYDRFNIDKMNTYNMLAGVSGMGQAATGQMAGAGQNYATNTGNLTTGLASAQLNAQMANASKPSMFDTLLGAGTQLGSAYLLSDRRLKTNIELIGEENGFNVYKFNYTKGGDLSPSGLVDDENTYIGVMADEVEKVDPSAVTVMPNGYKAVNYDKIGVQMRVVK